MTVEQILSDIEAQLLQGAPSDDSELSWEQLRAWVSYHLNALVANECNEKMKRGESIPPIYIKYQDCKLMEVEDGDCEDKLFIELPEKVLNLNDDRGILLVQAEDGDEILRISLAELLRIKKLRFAKPSMINPLYYRRERKIFILGFKEVDIPFEKVGVYFVPEQDLSDNSSEVLVTDLTLLALIDTVVQRGKLQMYGTQSDPNNDGVDAKEVQYHTAIANPQNQAE